MNNECEIVRDLLPSYIDKLCSKSSENFVSTHLEYCTECKSFYNQMLLELNMEDEIEIMERQQVIQPFQKVSALLKRQKLIEKALKWVVIFSLIMTIILSTLATSNAIQLNKEQMHQSFIEQEQEEIMSTAFQNLNQNGLESLEDVSLNYSRQIKYLAVFEKNSVSIDKEISKEPTVLYPLPYKDANIVYENGEIITNTITPNEYDIGTMVMEKGNYIIQFEYQDHYLGQVERAFQAKHYAKSLLEIWLPSAITLILTTILLIIWLSVVKSIRRSEGLIE
ncbi:zf-HC2 domain-containing protein [Psychrobacillus sp. NPDC096389]|uniref:zf-HC2 domain-containing protein n=1 Tax=Psychrobacillus sp. NPDC096389 TaxID=3364490 RepID=UPI0037FA816C